jgi:hypothetical protein
MNRHKVEIVKTSKHKTGASYGRVCGEMRIAYSSLMRWKSRVESGRPVVNRPGPAKVEPLDPEALHEEVRQLKAGAERTRGTGALLARYSRQISRRDFQAVVEQVRREVNMERDALERRVEWLAPGLVWSMDDTKKHWLPDRFGHVNLVMDLGSKYNLGLFGDEVQMNGWQVALKLEELFSLNEAPLFMKMDGGGNFRHEAVSRMCAQHMVIPLVSPPYYPPYNGAVEREHQEILGQLAKRIGEQKVTAQVLRLESEVSGHEINHKRRQSLGGRTACQAMEAGRSLARSFGRRKREEVYGEIKSLAVDIAMQLVETKTSVTETAFRYAAETWMQLNGLIRVSQNGRVLPCLYQI